MSAQDVGLAKGLIGNEQGKIDGKLHAGAGANGTDVFEPPAQLSEEGLRAGNVGGLATRQAQELALPRRPGGAADRTFDEGGALGRHLAGERLRVRGLHGAHVDDELAGDVSGQHSGRAVIGAVLRRGVAENGDDHLDGIGEAGGAGGDAGAGLARGFDLGGRAVPHPHLVPGFQQPQRDRGAHLANAGNANTHGEVLLAE